MAKDPSGANEIGPNSKMRMATVAILVVACCGAAGWCTTTTLSQTSTDKHLEKLEQKIDAADASNQRHYDDLRKVVEDLRFRLVYGVRTSDVPSPFSSDRDTP